MKTQMQGAMVCAVLSIFVVITAITCVYARHESRSQFTQLQSLIVQRDALEVDWGRLQIEQSTWSGHARVEQLARNKMHMRNPDPEEILVVQQ
jgi:cell division protein FtsL